MSNYRRAMLRNPTTYLLLVVFLVFVVYGMNRMAMDVPEAQDEPQRSTDTASQSPPPCQFLACTEFDEEGRAIVMLGELPLHIPKDVAPAGRPTNVTERDYALNICWHDKNLFGQCYGVENRVTIWLFKVDDPVEYPRPNAREDLEQRTHGYSGSLEIKSPDLHAYNHGTYDIPPKYVLANVDESGLYPVATCGGYSCRVRYWQHPQLSVDYRFHADHIDDWPLLHASVRQLIGSFIVE